MLSAGFKFICCTTEDDADNPKIVWTENLLSLEKLQLREERLKLKLSTTFLSSSRFDPSVDHKKESEIKKHRRIKSYDGFRPYQEKNSRPNTAPHMKIQEKEKLVHSLYVLTRGLNKKLSDVINKLI